jgi:hypothetical protein
MAVIRKVPSSASERPLTIIAQDPSVCFEGKVLTTQVMVPAERLAAGPWGYRVQVIDYDATNGEFFRPWDGDKDIAKEQAFTDPFAGRAKQDKLVKDPRFHAQNVYAIAMRVLSRFEFALGRRAEWSFASHQLKIAPHAFNDANAYYSRDHQALEFGYFQGQDGNRVFSCLSHDVVAHETTHAVLDGLHTRLIDPSTPDQAAFHEAFADVVALLSIFSLPDVVASLLNKGKTTKTKGRPIIESKLVTVQAMRESMLLGLAEQMGQEMNSVRGRPLRQSLLLEPSTEYLELREFQESHRRGEILVAAMLNAFLYVFDSRLKALDRGETGVLDLDRVIEEAAKAADHLLTISIRALDYCMPVHLTFSDYLSALLTSDAELVGDDSAYSYREHLRLSFADFGIEPASLTEGLEPGLWEPSQLRRARELNYGRAHYRSMQYDAQEVFRFLWENRDEMKLRDDVYTRVLAVRPCLRVSHAGFPLHETVVQYVQLADIPARELKRFRVERPRIDGEQMPASAHVTLQGGGTLIFDQYGRLKYDISSRIDSQKQSERVAYLWKCGHFREGYQPVSCRDFRRIHRLRATGIGEVAADTKEAWV